jgi:hypothetical protein
MLEDDESLAAAKWVIWEDKVVSPQPIDGSSQNAPARILYGRSSD